MLMHLYRLVPLLAVANAIRQVPLTRPASSPFTASFDKLVSENLDHWHTPGLAIAVIDGDDTFSKV